MNSLDHIILFDQLPRLFYPGKPKALEYDEFALEMTRFMLPGVRKMPCFEAMFVLMPLMHSEQMMDVDLFIKELTMVSRAVKATGKRHSGILLDMQIEVGQRHQQVLSKFDRYPQRNEVLGRDSSPQELEFLSKPHDYLDF